jgi:hypothetical protein
VIEKRALRQTADVRLRDPVTRSLTAGPYRGHGVQITTAREKNRRIRLLVKREHYIGNKGIAITEDNKQGLVSDRLVLFIKRPLMFDAPQVGRRSLELQTPVYCTIVVIQPRESDSPRAS